jgi:hypothetical protein
MSIAGGVLHEHTMNVSMVLSSKWEIKWNTSSGHLVGATW